MAIMLELYREPSLEEIASHYPEGLQERVALLTNEQLLTSPEWAYCRPILAKIVSELK